MRYKVSTTVVREIVATSPADAVDKLSVALLNGGATVQELGPAVAVGSDGSRTFFGSPDPVEIVAPKHLANDTVSGLRVTLHDGESTTVTLVFRTFEELAESGLIEGLRRGAAMMFGLGIWKRPTN